MRTKIDLLSSGIIDLTDDIPYSLNFAIADIRTPEKRDASYSKTIKIPGSKNNDVIFQHIWNIDMDCNFNPNKKAECIVTIDELQQLKGFMQLLKVIRNDGGKLEYEVAIKGQVGNVFTEWGEKELTDLDYTDLNHYYIKTNQKNTWSAAVGSGYLYPFIDYGATNGTTYDVENFYPALYLKEYIDRMFLDAGYTYNSTFFNSDFFKRLIVPVTDLTIKFSAGEVTARTIDVTQGLNYTIALPASSTYTDPITTLVKFDTAALNPSSQFNLSTEKWTVANTGIYNLEVDMSNLSYSTAETPKINFAVIRESAGVFYQLGIAHYNYPTATSLSLHFIPLVAGDKIHVGYAALSLYGCNLVVGNNSARFRARPTYTFASDGNLVDMNLFVPTKIKLKDFFSSVIKMFNLYVEQDKYIDNRLNIEPRNDFYSSGVVVDWTNKLDVSKELLLEPMGQLDAIRYKYTYKDDSDYWNKKYKDTHQEVYSTENYDIDNDFLKNTNSTEIIFSPTPTVNVPDTTDRNIPQIVALNSAGSIEKVKGYNIRLLYYGGVKSTAYSWKYTSYVEGTTIETTYPYCGMLDDTVSPSLSLDYGVPFEVYYNASLYTNNNLFNKYYKQFIEEITDKDSKIVTGYFALNPVDILKLDFRNEFFVNGYFLRLNKIFDYNPVVSQMTKCEFIKIKRANSFVAESKVTGVSDIKFENLKPTPVPIGGTKPQSLVGNIVKDGNFVDSTVRGAIVTGSNNLVGAGCENITLLNCSGVIVYPDVIGATVMNSSGVIVTENNVIYINDARVYSNAGYKVYSATLLQSLSSATSGSLIIGHTYLIESLNGGDNFTNVGYISDGVKFIATGTTPTNWTNSTIVIDCDLSAPAATVMENTLGSITFEWVSQGVFYANLTGAFTLNKTVFFSAGAQGFIEGARVNNNSIQFQTLDTVLVAATDGILNNTFIEIRVYQ